MMKVGDKVRIVDPSRLAGQVGTIVECRPFSVVVQIDDSRVTQDLPFNWVVPIGVESGHGRYAVLKDGRYLTEDRLEDALARCDHENGAVLYHAADDALLAELDITRGHLRKILSVFYEFSDHPEFLASCLGEYIDAADKHLNRRLARPGVPP